MADMVKAGREHWVKDESAPHCCVCRVSFGCATWRHHCRACGNVFCWRCSNRRIEYTPCTRRGEDGYTEKPKRVCERCYKDIREFRAGGEVTETEALALREDIRGSVRASLGEVADFQAELQEQRGEDVELDEAIQFCRERRWQSAGDQASKPCEYHKIHTFHEPLEDLHQFMYRDRTADIIVHSWGSTKADAFAQVSMGLLQYMTELLRRAAREAATATCQELEEFLFIFGYEAHASRDVEIVLFDEDALRQSASKRAAPGNAIPLGGSEKGGGAARARTQHLARRAGWRRDEEVAKKLSTGAAEELAGKLRRRQDTIGTGTPEPPPAGAQAEGEGDFCQEHTADIVVHCWGKSRANAFAQLCVGIFQYMARYHPGGGLTSTNMHDTESRDLLRLLHQLLDEFLYVFRIDGVQLSPHSDLVEDAARAARTGTRKVGVGNGHMRGASSELAYALKKRQYAVVGQRCVAPGGERAAPPPVAAEAAMSVAKVKEKQRQAAESSKMAEGRKRKKRQPRAGNRAAPA